MDCGSGLLLIIRNAMAPLPDGGVLEVRSSESSVREDLPAWCRMVGHEMVSILDGEGKSSSYFVCKKGRDVSVKHDIDQAKEYEWSVRLKWTEGMQAKAFCRNHSFIVGQPASFDTEDSAPSAVEFLLASLGACLAVGFQWHASCEKIEVYNLEVAISAHIDNILVFLGLEEEGDPGLSQVEATAYIDADAEDDHLEKLWQRTVKRSPVTNSLIKKIPVNIQMRRV